MPITRTASTMRVSRGWIGIVSDESKPHGVTRTHFRSCRGVQNITRAVYCALAPFEWGGSVEIFDFENQHVR